MATVRPSINPLSGAVLKLRRAHQHLQGTDSALHWFTRDEPFSFVTDMSPDGASEIVKAKLRGVSTDHILVNAADAIHNLRSALDHLAYALALREGFAGDMSKVYFPISRSKTAFEDDKNQQRMQEQFGAEACAYINEVQPYLGGNDLLWSIHELDRIDKHRSIIKIRLGGQAKYVRSTSDGSFQVSTQAQSFAEGEGIEIARYGLGSNPSYQMQVVFNISFDGVKPLDGQPIMKSLIDAFQLTERIVSGVEKRLFKQAFIFRPVMGDHSKETMVPKPLEFEG